MREIGRRHPNSIRVGSERAYLANHGFNIGVFRCGITKHAFDILAHGLITSQCVGFSPVNQVVTKFNSYRRHRAPRELIIDSANDVLLA